jgi:hypothetical protein
LEDTCREVRGGEGAVYVTDRGGRLSGIHVSGDREVVRVSGKRSTWRGVGVGSRKGRGGGGGGCLR